MNVLDAYPSANPLKTGDPRRVFFRGLAPRFFGLAGLFAVELSAISAWLDTDNLSGTGAIRAVADFGTYILQSLVVLATVLLIFGYSQAKPRILPINKRLVDVPPAWRFLAAHCAAMSTFAFLSSLLFGRTPPPVAPLILAWVAAGLCGVATGVFSLIPPKIVGELLGSVGSAWNYAIGASIITPLLVLGSQRLWKPATAFTFELVRLLLIPFVHSVISIPATKTIGTARFTVQIWPSCSGLEGVGLVLAFGLLWLWFFRIDYKFPQALFIIPVGVGLIFLLNAVRIALLILIGNAGASAVAVGGFHSQAGWIAFNGVALALASVTRRMPWLCSARSPAAADELPDENPAAPFLVPFLAILAAAMVTRAASGTFEWMYPVRFIAAAGTLLFFRHRYVGVNWKFSWAAPLVGVLVFILWIGLDRIAGTQAESGMPGELAAWPAAARIGWLSFRILAAVITVPIAEELAFRGFLLRRLISADFESISLQRWSFLTVAGSSVAFGLLHGDRWIAGTIAGLFYAAAQKWRGSIGDAIVAHGVTIALLAVWVLWSGHWSLW